MGMTKELATKCDKSGIKSIFDLLDMEDDDRLKLLSSMSGSKLDDVATMCNAYPNIELKYEIVDSDEITAGSRVEVLVSLERDADDEDEDEDMDSKNDNVVEPVYSQRYPEPKN